LNVTQLPGAGEVSVDFDVLAQTSGGRRTRRQHRDPSYHVSGGQVVLPYQDVVGKLDWFSQCFRPGTQRRPRRDAD
jgi:hypothetical protein